MSCDDPINATRRIAFNLKERTPYDPVTQMLNPDRSPLDLTGYTFESRFLDRDPDAGEGEAVVLDEAVVAIVGDPANGIYGELLTEAENDALIDGLPGVVDSDTRIFWEFFAILAGVRHRWFIADVGIEQSPPEVP
jgi:hypothetical protein